MTNANVQDRHRLPIADARRSRQWLGARIRQHPGALVGALMTGIVSSLAALVPFFVLGRLVDEVTDGGTPRSILPIVAVLAVAAVLAGTFSGGTSYAVSRLGETIVAGLRESALERVLNLLPGTVERTGRGDLLSRIGDDVARITRAAGDVVPSMISAALLVAVSVVAMFGLDYRLGVAGMLALPLYLLALRWYLPRSGPLYAAERAAMGDRSEALTSSIHGLRTVRAYGTENLRLAEIESASNQARTLAISVFRLFTRFVGRENRAEFFGLSILLVVGYFLFSRDEVTIGAVTTAVLLFHRLFNPLGTILFLFDEIQSAGASLNRLVGVVDIALPDRPQIAAPSEYTLALDGVRYSYVSGDEILHGISLTVPAGTSLALVGSTGAGKTTAALVAAGSIEPDSGTVTIGGVPLHDLGTAELRRYVSILSQDVHVTAGPLVDDLRLALGDVHDDDRIWNALDVVGAASWVRELPDGIDTVVGDDGYSLTAHRKQQLALARLVLVDTPVVVLDEATAEAGSSGARALERAAHAATRGRTTLVVAHRLTQAAAADAVAVLDAGRVVELGTHEDLVNAGGPYAQLWRAWKGSDAVGVQNPG
jgi:ATP-binding cassette subfamily C protein